MDRTRPRRDRDERTTITEMLEFYRATMLIKCEGLDHAQLNQPFPPTTMTLAGLLKHSAMVEDMWITRRFAGSPLPEPWASAPTDEDEDWEWHSASSDSPEYLRELYAAATARTDAAIRDIPLDTVAPTPDHFGNEWNLRWVLLHLIEEAARHAGHADLIRESIDGSVGV
jgi:uncharacterized damage-inducible protein DinB